MASLTKTYDNQKLLGQVYTPRFIVDKILDEVGFDGTLSEKTILDPSCGDGRFLVVVVERILKNTPKAKLQTALENVYGWDIDEAAITACKVNLDALTESLNLDINWRIEVKNPILEREEIIKRFDFIIGNPPYIRIQHLEKSDRVFIQEHYDFCKKGSTDLYIAFFELCLHILDKNGVCGLITPNTYFYTETGKELRTYFENNNFIQKISNYGAIQLFENATTYSAITVFDKKEKTAFTYEEALEKEVFEEKTIAFSQLKTEKYWALSIQEKEVIEGGKKLKEICRIHVGITTLADKAYIMPLLKNGTKTYMLESRLKGPVELEKGICKPIIKASKLKADNQGITEYVLFPYEKNDGKNRIISEEKLKSTFPMAYAYLLSVKADLDKRDAGKANKVAWYAFGRSQGLDTSFGAKILFSPMNKRPNFILSEHPEATFYSGYCIKYDGALKSLLPQLNSDRMEAYIGRSARDFRGGWKAYNKRVVEEFEVEVD